MNDNDDPEFNATIKSAFDLPCAVEQFANYASTYNADAPCRMPKNVEMFLTAYPPEVKELVIAARGMLLGVLPGAAETLDESAKVIGYGYGPGYKGLVCTLILSRAGVKLGIARGSELPDPKRLMQSSGKVHRHVALRTVADLKRPGLKPLLKATLAAWKERNTVDGRQVR